MYKNLTIISVLGALAVVLGAFGAHALKNRLSPEALDSFETAVKYQMFHVLFLLLINTSTQITTSYKSKISLLVITGIILFSGSIYAIQLLNVPAKYIWFITPLGGLLLILGWFLTSFYFLKKVIKSE